jgi:methyl-accepting chemotaxis protein
MTQSNGNQPDRLDILIDQVGRLTEVVTTGFADLKEGMADLKAITEQQAQVAKEQAENVSRLIGIVEGLLPPAKRPK